MQGKTDNLACSLIFLYLSDSIIIHFPLYLLKHHLLFLKLSYFSFKPHLSSYSSFQILPIFFSFKEYFFSYEEQTYLLF